MKYIKILYFAIPLAFFACGTPQQAVQQDGEPIVIRPEPTQPKVKQDESFNPLVLNDYDFQVETQSAELTPGADIDALLKGNNISTAEQEPKHIPGFRVQLISTRDIEEAQSVFRNAVISFGEKVYRSYDDPYYKIRVGDFQSRLAANDLQEQALTSGFVEAWVVKTMVWLNPEVVEEEVLP